MIDLHNHILPGVDDGARSVDDSRAMARALLAQGVSVVCATPHTTDWAHAGDAAQIRERVADLSEELTAGGIELRLLAGAEAHLSPSLAQDVAAGTIPTLNDSGYLLLEFPYDFLPAYYERIVFELQVAGTRVIIAHPERIAPLAEDPNLLYRLVNRGCLAQLTAMSLAGGFGPRPRDVSELLIEHRLVHLIASDAHDAESGGRLEAIAGAQAAATRLLGEEGARKLFRDVPASIISGLPVACDPPIEYKKRHFGFLKAFR